MQKDNIMYISARTAVALGFVGAMAIAIAAPAMAQGIYLGGRGVGVELGQPDRDYRHEGRGDRDRRYYDYSPGYGEGNGCPRHFTVQDGRCKPYRGY
jgi:hypothetical protein